MSNEAPTSGFVAWMRGGLTATDEPTPALTRLLRTLPARSGGHSDGARIRTSTPGPVVRQRLHRSEPTVVSLSILHARGYGVRAA